MDLKYGVVIMKRKRERDTDDSADSQNSQNSDYEQMSGNSVVEWDRSVDLRLLREMKDVRDRKGIYSYVRDWEDGWPELVNLLRSTPEFYSVRDSLTKKQLVERIHHFILPATRFDAKIKERPASIFEGLVYDVFHDHELCSPLQAERRIPPPFSPPPFSPPPTPRKRKPTSSESSSGSVLTSEEVILNCKGIMRSYGHHLSDGQRMGFEIALSINKYCNKLIAAHTHMDNQDFIAFLKETAEDFPISPYCMSAVVPETEAGNSVAETEE